MLSDLQVADTPTGDDALVHSARTARDPRSHEKRWFSDLCSTPGEDWTIQLVKQFNASQLALVKELTSVTTGYRLLTDQVLNAFLNLPEAAEDVATGCQAADQLRPWLGDPIGRQAGWPQRRPHLQPMQRMGYINAPTPAARIRELSGVDAGRLAELFGVSRATYQQWVSGSTPRGHRRDHLLELLPLLQEATEYFGGPKPTSTWLLTPVSPGGRRPIDFLSEHQYQTFRGCLLREPVERRLISRPRPFGQRRQTISRPDLEDALQRISPRTWDD